MFISLKQVYTLIIVIVCTIGLVYQSFTIYDTYLKYCTTSIISITETDEVEMPQLSACFSIVDVIKTSEVKKHLDIDWYHRMNNNFSSNHFFDGMKRLTIEGIFNFTPQVNEVFADGDVGCSIRFPGKYFLTYFNATDCYKQFKISRYIHREFICYKFSPIFTEVIQYASFVYTQDHFGLVYQLKFNEPLFEDSFAFTTCVHDSKSIELYDSSVTKLHVDWERRRTKSAIIKSAIRVRADSFTRTLLMPPFSTNCQHYPVYRVQENWRWSLISQETMQQLKRVLTAAFVYKQLRYPMLTVTDLENQTIAQTFQAIVDRKRDLGRETCHYKFFLQFSSLDHGYHTSFSVFWPTHLNFAVSHVPQQQIIDLIVYIFSTVGFWFGVSVFSVFYGAQSVVVRTFSNKSVNIENFRTKSADIEKLKKNQSQLKNRIEKLERIFWSHRFTDKP